DILGIPKIERNISINKTILKKILNEFEGHSTLPFPPYSSYKIKGKPLFWWARNNKLDEIMLPRTSTEIYNLSLLELSDVTKDDLLSLIPERIDLVSGDFRQNQIKEKWHNILTNSKLDKFSVATVEISCSSGTYIRTIANETGRRLKTGAILLHLKRTQVGDYKATESIKIVSQ
ncbi:MAG: hypothetical protein R3346_01670, partial [Candidatus Spechtbacterales bacterium]|nr:hypothetical protein [Candidatus Spechtbacterales bacterium]